MKKCLLFFSNKLTTEIVKAKYNMGKLRSIGTSFLLLFTLNCGTLYIPQILPEARGVGKSIGQENIAVQIIPMTNESIANANNHPYIRRVIEANDLEQPARLVSVEEAIDERLPPPLNFEPYLLGVGDTLLISQKIEKTENGFDVDDQTITAAIASRPLNIADDGFVSILGIGRIAVAGKTQNQAEELIYRELVSNQIDPEFEFQISGFNSKKVYIFNIGGNNIGGNTSAIPFTNTPLYLHQVLAGKNTTTPKGQDALVILKRDNKSYRLSLKSILEGTIRNIRIKAEDRIFVEPLPYRPEKAILIGEVSNEKLFPISAEGRESLGEALYSGGGVIIRDSSDTSQVFVIRELENSETIAYHLDSSNPARLTLAAKFELRPNDIIYVAPQFVTNYNRALSQIFSAYYLTTGP